MKMIFTLLIVVASVFISTDISDAQWIQQNNGIPGNLSDVVILDSLTAIATARNGSILRTTNDGATWFDVSLPMSYGGLWNAISFYDTTCGVLVGDNRAVFWSFNGGKGWLWGQVPNPRNCLCVENCLSVISTGPGSCCVGTDSGFVYSTSDTGRTWNFEKVSHWPIRLLFKWRGEILTGVSQYALTPYSICTQCVVPPPSWGEAILPNFQGLGSEAFDAEFCNGGGAGFIVGVQGDLTSSPAVLRKLTPGSSWEQIGTNMMRTGTLLTVSAPSADVVFVAGTGGMMYKSSDGGDTWHEQVTGTTKKINAIYFRDEKHGFAVGDSGLILYTSGGGLTAMGDRKKLLPSEFSLQPNYPNPFNPSTIISYQLPVNSHVVLKVYDVLGREVRTLVDEVQKVGRYEIKFDGNDLASGVYFCRMVAGNYLSTRKLLLLK